MDEGKPWVKGGVLNDEKFGNDNVHVDGHFTEEVPVLLTTMKSVGFVCSLERMEVGVGNKY